MSPRRNFATASASVGAALALLLAPLAAQAAKVKVVVVPYAPLYDSIPRATGEQIAQTLESGLSSKDSIELVKLPADGEGSGKPMIAASAAQLAAVEAAKADFERGKGLLAKRKVKPALDAFDKAIAGFEANGPALLEVEPLVQAQLKKAVALFLMGREDQALQGAIPAALRLDPTFKLEAGAEYQQVFIDQVEKVRKQMQAGGNGQLRVDTTPPGAKIWLDGREASYSPVMVTGVLPGTHYVKVKPPGADPYVQVVEIKKGELFRITPDDGKAKEGQVGALVTFLSKNQLDDGAKKQVQALAKKLGAEKAVIGGAYAQGANMGIVTYLYSAKENGFTELQKITLDREMLGATIEINKISNELETRLASIDPVSTLPRPMAEGAKPGEEKINEVDFSGDLAAGASVAAKKEEQGGKVTPASGSRAPAGGRRPIGAPAAPAPTGGGKAPETAAATPAPAAPAPAVAAAPATEAKPTSGRAPAGAPAAAAPAPVVAADDTGMVFRDEKKDDFAATPKAEPERKYQYAAGTTIEDETAFDQPVVSSSGGLLSKWWFWTGVGVLAAGAVTAGVMAGGSTTDNATGKVTW